MGFSDEILSLLNKEERDSGLVQRIAEAIGSFLEKIAAQVVLMKNRFYFDSLDLEWIKYYENLLKISPLSSQSLVDRQSAIQAKWLSKNHNSIAKIQDIANCWKRGETLIDFLDGKISVEFIGAYGTPNDIESLKEAIEDIKPAHLPYELKYRYLRKKDIHQILTKRQMQELIKDKYCASKQH